MHWLEFGGDGASLSSQISGQWVDFAGSGSVSRLVKNTLSVLLIDTASKVTMPLLRLMLICVSMDPPFEFNRLTVFPGRVPVGYPRT